MLKADMEEAVRFFFFLFVCASAEKCKTKEKGNLVRFKNQSGAANQMVPPGLLPRSFSLLYSDQINYSYDVEGAGFPRINEAMA